MSQRQQLDQFDTNFVKSSIREWSKLSATYEEQSKKVYKKIRSYLTLYQFRLSNQQRCDVREMLSQELDEIESSANIIEEMDSFLDVLNIWGNFGSGEVESLLGVQHALKSV